MSVRMGLLALLEQHASYGYQLKAEFDARTGGAWPVNTGQIYATLERLERDGMVVRDGLDDEGRVRYSIAASGTDAVAEWVRAPILRQTDRDDLAMKLSMVSMLPGVAVGDVIQAQRKASMKTLQDLTRTKPAQHTPTTVAELAWALVVESMIFATEAEMRWLDYAEELIAAAQRAGVSAVPPSKPPRRGRPVRSSEAAEESSR